jgi:hypothetical protein
MLAILLFFLGKHKTSFMDACQSMMFTLLSSSRNCTVHLDLHNLIWVFCLDTEEADSIMVDEPEEP